MTAQELVIINEVLSESARLSNADARALTVEIGRRILALEVETDEEDKMIRIDGKSFRCDCGCNVFKTLRTDASVYVCNSCQGRFRGEK